MNKIIVSVTILILITTGVIIYSSSKGKNQESVDNSEQSYPQNDQYQLEETEDFDTTEQNSEEPAIEGETTAILFYGYSCSYCKIVSDWLEKNNVKSKVKYDYLEIYKDKDNNNLLTEKAKICGLDSDKIGVPFLFDIKNSQCLSGSDKIIKYFEEKI